MNDLIHNILRTRLRNVLARRPIHGTKTDAYNVTGAAASLLSAIHSVVNGISDTEKRCAKFDYTSRGVASSA